MSERYILDAADNPVACPDLLAWAEWMEHGERVTAQTPIRTGSGAFVSTVFLGLDRTCILEKPSDRKPPRVPAAAR